MRGYIFVIQPFGEDAMGKVYTIDYNDLPKDVELTKGLAYTFFEKGRKLHSIKGKQFNFRLGDSYYFIGQVVLKQLQSNGKIKTFKTYKIYDLGAIDNEHDQSVVGEDGHDSQ